MKKFNISINKNIDKIKIDGMITPSRAMANALKGSNFMHNQVDADIKKAYYNQLQVIAEDYVKTHTGKGGLKEIKDFAKSIQELYPDIKTRPRDTIDIKTAIDRGFIQNKLGSTKNTKTILYVMDIYDQMFRHINRGVELSNKITLKHAKKDEDDIPNLLSFLDFAVPTHSFLDKADYAETLSETAIKKLITHKAVSSAYGADETTYSLNTGKIKQLSNADIVMNRARSGNFNYAQEIASLTSNKHVKSLLFINNLYKAVNGQGWSDIKSLMDQLTPHEIELAYKQAAKTLKNLGKSVEFIFKYEDEKFSDDTDTYETFKDALLKQLNNHMKKVEKQINANKKLKQLQEKSNKDNNALIDTKNINIVNDIFEGAKLEV